MTLKINIARLYLRVSTEQQDLQRQEDIVQTARTAGYYVAGIYREKASGARADRPELLRLIADLQPNEIVIAEKIDRISRLPLVEAERRYKGRKARANVNDRIITLRQTGHSIARTADLANCSISQVKRIWAKQQKTTQNSAK